MKCYYDVMAFHPHKIAVHAIFDEFGIRPCLKIETLILNLQHTLVYIGEFLV